MAEVEAAPAAPAPAPDVSTSDAPAYDESLLIKDAKGKVKKPAKPDDTERNKQVEKLQEQITKYSDRIKDIKALIESKRGSSRSQSGGQRDIRKRIQDLRNEFQSVLRQKQHIRDELNEANKSREETRAALRAIRDRTKETRIEDVDAKVADLEERMRHDSSLSAQDEKRLHDQISKLNASKPLVKEHAVLSAKLQQIEAIRTEIIDRLKKCDAVLNDVKSKENDERAALDAVVEAETSETADVPTLHAEKQECYQIIVSLREKIGQIRNDFNEKYQEWIKLDKAYNAYSRHQRKLQYEERKKEREVREVQKKAIVETNAPEPFEVELLTCDQVVAYLKRLQGTQEEAVQSTAAADLSAPAPGMKLLRRKGEDEGLESLFAGSGKKGKGAKKEAAKDKVDRKPATKKIVHDLDTLKSFMLLKVDVPQTTAEVGKTLEAVVARKEEYVKKREERKNAPPPAPEAEAEANGKAEAESEEKAEANGAEAESEEKAEADEAEAEPEEKAEANEAEAESEEKAEANEAEAESEKPQANGAEAESEEKADANGAESEEKAEANSEAEKLARDVSVTLSVTEDSEVEVSLEASKEADKKEAKEEESS